MPATVTSSVPKIPVRVSPSPYSILKVSPDIWEKELSLVYTGPKSQAASVVFWPVDKLVQVNPDSTTQVSEDPVSMINSKVWVPNDTSVENSEPISSEVMFVVLPLGIVARLLRSPQRRIAEAPFAGLLVRGKTTSVTTISLGARRAMGFTLEIVMPSALLTYLAWVPIAKKLARVNRDENNILDFV